MFGAGAWLLYRLQQRRDPEFERWTFAFPVLILFLLTNKVYSPQYGLWLLPWFALLALPWRHFVLFQVADIGVFMTRFSFLGTFKGVPGVGAGPFELALMFRAAALLACLVAWLNGPPTAATAGSLDALELAAAPDRGRPTGIPEDRVQLRHFLSSHLPRLRV